MKLKKNLLRVSAWFARCVLFGACAFASVFLLMSGYESVYNRSLPFVHTLAPVNLKAFDGMYDLQNALSATKDPAMYGNFGKPQTVKLPARSLHLDVVAPLQQDKGIWLARSNTLHLLLPIKPRSGNIGVALLYCRSSFRTINDQNLPSVGSNIFMDTDHDWRYVYKVTSAKVFTDTDPYIAADSGGNSELIIDCNNSGNHTNIVVEANLLSVQGVGQ